MDLRDAADQERVFANDLADRKAFYERMERVQTGRGEFEKARDIEEWRLDPVRLTRGLARYLQGDRGDNLVIVFDNVDRRDTQEQVHGVPDCSLVALPRLLFELEALGFVRSDVADAARFCLTKGLLEVEISSADTIRDRDSIKATASGWAHMRLLSSCLEYLASILPTTPINDAKFSARVWDLTQIENRSGRLSSHQIVSLVQGFENYLREQSNKLCSHPGYSGRPRSGAEYVLNKLQEVLTHARKAGASYSGQPDLLDV